MAHATGNFNFIGSLGNLTAYKMRGSDKIIVRTKGGPTKNQIKKSPRFDLTRRNNREFGGRAAASSHIMRMMWLQKALADYNIAGVLNAMLKPIQLMDLVNEWGSRSVQLSKNPRLLEGFNLNRNHPFDSIVRCPVLHTLSKDSSSVRVDIPALLPEINFFVPAWYPMFQFIVSVGVVPDVLEKNKKYQPVTEYNKSYNYKVSEWFPVGHGSPGVTLEIEHAKNLPDAMCSVMLSIGICFGNMGVGNKVEQIKYAGSAKILGMA